MAIIDAIAKGMGAFTKSTPRKWLGKKFIENPEKALGMATVTSIILKDGIGCAMYVTQSLNNKKIPDEKRKFVAALDLTNGLLMILAQIGMYKGMQKYSGKIFNKLFAKSFSPLVKSETISRMRMQAAKLGQDVSKKLGIEKEFDAAKKSGLDLFKFVADIAAATIVGKRVIVPLIATPLASKVEKWMDKRDAKKNGDIPDESNTNKSNPSMKGIDKNNILAEKELNATTNLLEQYKSQLK